MRSASVVVFTAVLATACGGSSGSSMGSASGGAGAPSTTPSAPSSSGTGGTASGASGGGFVINIQGLTYAPANLTVPPGATVTVNNLDNTPHSVTSEATPGAFTPGSVSGVSFDTGAFSSGTRTFTIPASAPDGTVIPFYCTVHREMMAPPNGSLTVSASAAPSTAPTAPATAPGTPPTTPTPTPTPMPAQPY